jgi:hypothetical protein
MSRKNMNLIAVPKHGPHFVPDRDDFAPDDGIQCWDHRSSPPCSTSYHVYVAKKLTKDEIIQFRQMARAECHRQHPNHEPRITL